MKIKVFDIEAILNEENDIHYHVSEMASRSRLSSICWNKYIKRQIVSSDFEGVVHVWDVTRRQILLEMREHQKCVWSIDFSRTDPTKLASGSDDGTVKLWDINQAGSTGTIQTKNFAGLSVFDGSETNEVFVYHKAFPMPVLCCKFNNEDSILSEEVDDRGQFISCVCWRGQSSTLLAAYSCGNIQILEMV